jgi:U6 snRNA phosphodiesterase
VRSLQPEADSSSTDPCPPFSRIYFRPMPLVSYSSSSESDSQPTVRKRKRIQTAPQASGVSSAALPPLPSSFHDLYATAVRPSASDDPSLHGGRKRTIPHIEGNWPTHVYIECTLHSPAYLVLRNSPAIGRPTSRQTADLSALVSALNASNGLSDTNEPHSLLQTPLGAPAPLHISLSRALSIPTASRAPFEDKVRRCIRNEGVRHFVLRPNGRIGWFGNEEGGRWFLVLGVTTSWEDDLAEEAPTPEGRTTTDEALTKLLRAANTAARALELPELYAGWIPSQSPAPPGAPHQQQQQHSKKRRRSAHVETAARAGSDMVPLSPATAAATASSPTDSPFHISLAWQLQRPARTAADELDQDPGVRAAMDALAGIRIVVDEVKIKSGNEIKSVALEGTKAARRTDEKGILG